MTVSRRPLLLAFAIVAAVLAVAASEEGEDIILNALSWVAIAIGLIAGALL